MSQNYTESFEHIPKTHRKEVISLASADAKKKKSLNRPTMGPEDVINEMISDAMNLARSQLKDGTAKAQVITHFLQLGTRKSEVELEILQGKKKLIDAQTEQIQSQKKTEEMFSEAISAMKKYSGSSDPL